MRLEAGVVVAEVETEIDDHETAAEEVINNQ